MRFICLLQKHIAIPLKRSRPLILTATFVRILQCSTSPPDWWFQYFLTDRVASPLGRAKMRPEMHSILLQHPSSTQSHSYGNHPCMAGPRNVSRISSSKRVKKTGHRLDKERPRSTRYPPIATCHDFSPKISPLTAIA